MRGGKTDKKNIELVKQLSNLRDHIDVQRIIGLNAQALAESKMSQSLLGYLQQSALESLAIQFCKIYESSNRHDLNSIPGIIDSLQPTPLSPDESASFAAFGEKYGNHAKPTESKSYLLGTFGLFTDRHSDAMDQLRKFRNTIGAHSDSKAIRESLPSHAEFEDLHEFAKDFYDIVSRSIVGVGGPASLPDRVGRDLMKLFESMGVQDVRFDFGPDD